MGAHNFMASRNFWTNLTLAYIVWQPLVEAFPEVPQAIREGADLVYIKLLIKVGVVREWYLGERITRQSIVAPSVSYHGLHHHG